jgi:Polyketide cyclase / dehydrase and lipid transport
MLKKILIGVAAIVVIFVAYVATRPSQYRIERSVVINTPANDPFMKVVIFRNWYDWSPWAKLDPKMTVEYGGPKGGVGSTYHWKGDDKVGEGRMTMTGALPNQLVEIRLEFLKPWEQTSTTEFRFSTEGGGTKVTWSMYGTHDFVGKLFALFVDMDKAVGPDLEKGLKALKALSEE